MRRILGIETSCDETAAAVIEVSGVRGQGSELKVLSNVVASQVKIHAKTGGVVPEVAARKHAEVIVPVIEEALLRARDKGARRAKGGKGFTSSGSSATSVTSGSLIDVIAVTAGPGLVTSLLVGVEVARTLAWLWKKPVVAVNHLAGHVYANWLPVREIPNYKIQITNKFQNPNIKFPILCLIVSGGHTELVLMRRHLDFQVIGSTRDDAAGEAFDKVAKMLGLGYPGGPEIAAEAAKFDKSSHSESSEESRANARTYVRDPSAPLRSAQDDTFGVNFPRPMIDSPDLDFSFSGLKTAVLYYIKEQGTKNKEQISFEFQEAVVDVLVAKTVRAAKQYQVKTVLLGGGVAANTHLRQRLADVVAKELLVTTSYHLPSVTYSTDNAAMIAAAGYFMAKAKHFTPWQKLEVDPNWALGKPQKARI